MNRPNEIRSLFVSVDLAREPDFVLGDLQVRPSLRRVICNGREEAVQPRVMQVLVALARARGEVVSREELVGTCWDGVVVGDDSITHSIAKVRQLADLGGAQAFDIETIPKVGYRLRATAEPATQTKAPETSRYFPRSPPTYAASVSGMFLLAVLAFAGWEYARPGPSAREPSIAVLPFANLSSDRNAGYFAAGVRDEILTRLAKIGSLKVISRTSADQFAGRSANIRQVANELDVANVLEGNVQKSGNYIRINVQLIRATTDEHLWAEDYDRKAGDLFSVESEVAGAIATVLAAKVTPGEKTEIAARPTDSPRAYDLYLRGLVFAHKDDGTSLHTAIQLFQQAVAADPKFAVAWARLASIQAHMHFGDDLATVQRGAAHAALAKALELNPGLAEVQTAKGLYLYYGEMNYSAAERELKRIHARWPNNADALDALALVLRREGKWKESTNAFVKLVALDPLVPSHRTLLAWNLVATHNFAAALRVTDDTLKIWPDNAWTVAARAVAYQAMGQLDLADAALKNVRLAPDNTDVFRVIWAQFELKRQFGNCAAYFKGSLDQDPDAGADVTAFFRAAMAECLHLAGDAKGAWENYSRALELSLVALKAHPNDMNFLNLLPIVYSGLHDSRMAMASANHAIEIFRASNDAMEVMNADYARLEVMATSGDRGAAIAELSRLMKLPGGPTPALVRLDPEFDRLRGDPRFEKLLHSDAVANQAGLVRGPDAR
ncbi:MAG TPA: winged helix-turn-helix domain-containing protein [Rhizomicrobium sp.]|nr:winged helix-turn-helix domain-containing protein [Rhizomicrobium sp.]